MLTLLRHAAICLLGFLALELHASGNLSVTLAPSAAVSAGAKWRVDNGTWRSSGTATKLAAGTHQLDFRGIPGWVTPASTPTTVYNAQTTNVTATYVQMGAVSVTLSPNSAQWQVDGGTWQPSGGTVGNLAPGNHTLAYSGAAGYITPASETVTVTSGQTLTLSRAYVMLASLTVSLAPSAAQWRIDGGSWQNSGATLSNLALGNHTIAYSSLDGYATPATETISLTDGSNALTRSYVVLASLTVTLAPAAAQWRVDGGEWQANGATLTNLSVGSHAVDYAPVAGYITPASESATLVGGSNALSREYVMLASLTVTLSPGNAQWRLDGGAWMASGTTVSNVAPGAHVLDYASLSGYTAPASETVNLASGANTVARTYAQLATLTVTLTPAEGRWRLDGGAWQSAGTILANLSLGAHTVDFSAVDGYATPASQTLTLVSGSNTLTVSYTQLASLSATLTPNYAKWRIDGGYWQNASGVFNNLSLGQHTVDFAPLDGYITPASQTVTLVSGSNSVSATYTALASLSANLTPNYAQWRIDGGAWQTASTFLNNLSLGQHIVDFGPVEGYVTPDSQTVTLVSGSNSVSATYTPLASLSANLTPNYAQWRIDGGTWQTGSTFISNLSLGQHIVDFEPVDGYVTPDSQTVTLVSGWNSVSATYTPLASLSANLTPNYAEWRIDGGAWQTASTFLNDLSLGQHTVDFAPLEGYITPDSQTVTLVSGWNSVSATYTPLASLSANLTPNEAQWRVDGGAWQMASTVLNNLSLGQHIVDFSPIDGYTTPPSQTVTLVSGWNSVSATYTPLASLSADLTPNEAQWRVDGGDWNTIWTFLHSLSLGQHVVDFAPVDGYITPDSQTVTLVSGSNTVTATYTRLASLSANLTPNEAQWRVDGGDWNTIWTFLHSLSLGQHVVDFAPVDGYITPDSQTVTLASGSNTVTATYTPLASLRITTVPDCGQWRIDGGAWQTDTTMLHNLSLGAHVVDYCPVPGYTPPPSETINLASGTNTFTRNYTIAGAPYAQIATFVDAGTNPGLISGRDGSFYGFCNTDGGNRGGVIFRISADGSTYTTLASMMDLTNQGLAPTALLDSADGYLYGATANGGVTSANGTMFRLNHDGTGHVTLVACNDSYGVSPNALIEGSDGRLYGTAPAGGAANDGIVFALAKDGTGFTVLKTFVGGADGQSPLGIVEGPGATLLGVFSKAGANGLGGIFKLNEDGSGYTVLRAFAGGTDAGTPRAGLLLGADGALYGTTGNGGAYNRGTVYRINLDGSGFTLLKSFRGDATDGSAPSSALSEDQAGVLYGATASAGSGGAGTVFKLNKDGSGYTILESFTGGTTDGGTLIGTPLVVRGAVLFGVNRKGGAAARGLMFSVNTDGTGFTSLQSFGAPGGAYVLTPVIEGADGRLYGSTSAGGSAGNGVLYRMNADGTNPTVLYHIPTGMAANFSQGVIDGGYGILYGALGQSVFLLSPYGGDFSSLHTFTGADGSSPQGVTAATDGQLYGTTAGGGANGFGTVFLLSRNGTQFTTLHHFGGADGDGRYPYATVTEGADGRLYGTTSAGGSANAGTVFGVNTDGSGYAVLKQFAGDTTDSVGPWATITYGSDGRLYGTTSGVNANGINVTLGTIFTLAPDGSDYRILKSFTGSTTDGGKPLYSGVVERNGVLYGTTSSGGAFNRGIVYRVNRDGTGFTVLVSFGIDETEGLRPAATLTSGASGALWGTNACGGRGSTVFRVLTN